MGGISLLHKEYKEYIEYHDQREYKESLRVHQKAITTKTASSVDEG
jgi:ribulose bisphosphate carboxylase small subunit